MSAVMEKDHYLETLNSTQLKLLNFLGAGDITQHEAAIACGVTESYVSQLMSIKEFADRVSELRYERLTKRNEIDDNWDNMELRLQGKLSKSLNMIIKPNEILNAIKIVNSAQRRGSAGVVKKADAMGKQVTLVLPNAIIKKIVVDKQSNRVVEIEQNDGNDVSLITATSASLDSVKMQLGNRKVNAIDMEVNNEQGRTSSINQITRSIRNSGQAISAEDL